MYFSWKPTYGDKLAVLSAFQPLKMLLRLLEEQKAGPLLVTEVLLFLYLLFSSFIYYIFFLEGRRVRKGLF